MFTVGERKVLYCPPPLNMAEKIADILLDFGTRIQYSVFECIMDNNLLKKMTARLSKLISDDDSVRVYTLCVKCEGIVMVMGKEKLTKDAEVYVVRKK